MKLLRIGTRGSKLALWQANTVARLIAERGSSSCEIVVIRTSGDESSGPPDLPAAGTNVKGLFVKEIDERLLNGTIDLAVHSSKDLPAVLPDGLSIGAALERDDPRDAVLLPDGESVSDLDALTRQLGSQPRLGTSSVRRRAQLATIIQRAAFVPLRGNVDTRIRKLDGGACDAAVLAVAGLKRLGLANRISFALDVSVCIPAPGQGIVAVESRAGDAEAGRALASINDAAAMDALAAERAVVSALGGGCQMPLGAYAQISGEVLSMIAVVISRNGAQIIRAECQGRRIDARSVGEALAQSLVDRGALRTLTG